MTHIFFFVIARTVLFNIVGFFYSTQFFIHITLDVFLHFTLNILYSTIFPTIFFICLNCFRLLLIPNILILVIYILYSIPNWTGIISDISRTFLSFVVIFSLLIFIVFGIIAV